MTIMLLMRTLRHRVLKKLPKCIQLETLINMKWSEWLQNTEDGVDNFVGEVTKRTQGAEVTVDLDTEVGWEGQTVGGLSGN